MANAGAMVRATDYGTPTAPIGTSSAGTVTSSTTETVDAVLGTISFTAVPGVRYKASYYGRAGSLSVANDRFALRYRYTLDGTTPTASSTQLGADYRYIVSAAAIGNACTHIATAIFVAAGGTPVTVKINTTWQRVSGTGTCTPTGICELLIEAIGTV
jgi:hypothetical protein